MCTALGTERVADERPPHVSYYYHCCRQHHSWYGASLHPQGQEKCLGTYSPEVTEAQSPRGTDGSGRCLGQAWPHCEPLGAPGELPSCCAWAVWGGDLWLSQQLTGCVGAGWDVSDINLVGPATPTERCRVKKQGCAQWPYPRKCPKRGGPASPLKLHRGLLPHTSTMQTHNLWRKSIGWESRAEGSSSIPSWLCDTDQVT